MTLISGVPTPDEQALMESALLGQLDEFQRLVPDLLSPDTFDAEKRSPLMFAAFNGQTSVIDYLLEAGASVDAKDYAGRTALSFARQNKHSEVVALLESLPEPE